MKIVPLVAREAMLVLPTALLGDDQQSVGDELPAAVERDAMGHFRGRQTQLTEVKRETTDDT
ncbi:hypothetical protein [Tahibacter sp.]|uniref:hypothetical protein n=1 Tax=Tahibacter sp. TaxID=2056211 RepID=UPI0028C45480|nr:hypothetical protein [Tahibacter sp.]